MTDFSELIKVRRSIREFEDRKVSPEIIENVLAESCQAPSAANEKPWRFIVIYNKDMIKRLSDESKANLLSRIEENPNMSIKKYRDILVLPEFNVFYNAPCLILISGPNKRRTYFPCGIFATACLFPVQTRCREDYNIVQLLSGFILINNQGLTLWRVCRYQWNMQIRPWLGVWLKITIESICCLHIDL